MEKTEISKEAQQVIRQRLFEQGAELTDKVATEQALETYDKTLRDEPYFAWPNWVRAVALAIDTHNTSDLANYPPYALAVYEVKSGNRVISYSDSK